MTTTLDTLRAIAAKHGITITESGPNHVKVTREGYLPRRVRRAATEEATLAEQIAGHLHPASHTQEWATVKTVLNPGTPREKWLTVAKRLYNN